MTRRLAALLMMLALLALPAVTSVAADETHDTHAAQATAADAAHGDDAHGDGHAKRTLLTSPSKDGALIFQEMLWTIIVFAIFFAVLSLGVWPKILAALQARENKQRKDLQDAELAAKKAQATLEEYKTQLAEARQEAQKIVDESRTAAQQVASQVKTDAEREIGQLKERTTKEIAAAKESAMADIFEQSAVLSTQIAGRILKRELNPQDQQGLVTESLQQLQRENN